MTKDSRIKISLCYIVKNEAAVLERSLLSAEKAADEIVVVDTGSTDDTVNIARAHGARVFSYAWKEHFADARNFALEKVTGDWIVFLDADEYFTDETKANIRTVMENADRNGVLLAYNDLAYSVTLNDTVDSGTGKNEKLNTIIFNIYY